LRPLARENLDLRRARSNGSGVKSIPLGSVFSVALLCLASSGFASSVPQAPVSMGDNTWSITREAKNGFSRDIEKVKADATDAATKFCAEQGKQMRVLSLTQKTPMFGTGYFSAKIVFRAVNPGDPELTAPVPVPGAPVQVVYAPVERRITTDELYSELVKLDDLRKKGILTDDEFQAEKKKLLIKSN
jgi:hypothetical protein